MMASTLLIALDGSELAETSLPWAAALARRRGLSILLAQVLPWPLDVAVSPLWGSYVAPAVFDEVLSSQREAATEYLSEVQERLTSEGLTVEFAVRQGEPARTLVDLAEEWNAYALAVATHGRGGLTRMLLGSVAERVLQQATVPVLLVRAGTDRPGHLPALDRLLIPLDGSPLAERALDVALELATDRATLVLVRVVAPARRIGSADEGRGPIPDDEATRRGLVEAEEYLRPLAEGQGPATQTVVSRGDAPEEILAAAKEYAADLIVMSTHGRTGPQRWVLGSVADHVVRRSERPVLLISARAVAAEAAGRFSARDVMTHVPSVAPSAVLRVGPRERRDSSTTAGLHPVREATIVQESDASEHARHAHTAPEPPPSSWGLIYPEGDIIAVIDDRDEADSAVRALEAIGIPAGDIFLIEGRRAVEIIEDFRQHQHVLGRIGRAISRVMSDSLQFEREYLDEARKGHHLLAVHAPSAEEVERVRPVLDAHQAHGVRHYGPLSVGDLR